MKRLAPKELDERAAELERIGLREEALRSELLEQIAEHGFSPPKADKSKRLLGNLYQFTVSIGSTTDINDAEVKRIAEICDGETFSKLFREVTKYKLVDGAMIFLAGPLRQAPRNLRMLFNRAVQVKETAPRLRIEKLEIEVKRA